VQQHSDTAAVLYLQKVNVVLLWSARDRRLMTLWYCFGNRFLLQCARNRCKHYSGHTQTYTSPCLERVWNFFYTSIFFFYASLSSTLLLYFFSHSRKSWKRKKNHKYKIVYIFFFFFCLNNNYGYYGPLLR